MKKVLRFRVAASMVFLLCLATAIAAPAQTFTTLVNFDGANGANPGYGSLIQAFDGRLYGTTTMGGANNEGTVFKITSTGILTTLQTFDTSNGAWPNQGLVQTTDGSFYGTTIIGGANDDGAVFKVTPAGDLTAIYSFQLTDGGFPVMGLTQASDGNFYGTTAYGGNYNVCNGGCGTVFKITPLGTLTTLHSFGAAGPCADGCWPYGGLVEGTDGNLYGTTSLGGAYQWGTIFKISTSGMLTTLHSFNSTDGAVPESTLIQAANGSFYGTTFQGGAYSLGTVFKVSPAGKLTTLHSFNSPDGTTPYAGLVQATDGNFYGTTLYGGANCSSQGGCGTIFEVTPTGTLTTLHNFDSSDGTSPYGGLVQATNGNLYGTTSGGGTSTNCSGGCGTIFSLSVGLRPFVKTLPASGKVGSKVIILGNNLTGSTSVTFNGTAATFTVVSSTEITTTVPTGATSGKVQVTTPHGTLTSNVVFRVK